MKRKRVPMRSERGVEALANAIVLQAVKDYRRNYHNKDERESLERFFASPWCATLTGVDGNWLLREIRERMNT